MRRAVGVVALVLAATSACSREGAVERVARPAPPSFVRTLSWSGASMRVTPAGRVVLSDARGALWTLGVEATPPSVRGDVIAWTREEAVEEVEVGPRDHLEQRWRFDAPPESGRVAVRVPVDGVARVERGADGLVLHSSRRVGARLRYSHGTWIDSTGARWPVEARWEDGAIVLEVAADVVARTRFPAVLDPSLEPIFGFDEPVELPWTVYLPGFDDIAGNEHGYVLAFLQDSGSSYRLPRTVFVPASGPFSDPWGEVLDPRHPYANFGRIGVVREGSGFLVSWAAYSSPSARPHVVRLQRLDELGRQVGTPFDVASGSYFASGVLLRALPGSTSIAWGRWELEGRVLLCSARLPHGERLATPPQCVELPSLDIDRLNEPNASSFAASTEGWIAAWIDPADQRVHAKRFLEADSTVDDMVLSDPLRSGVFGLAWWRGGDTYRVAFSDRGWQFVDVPIRGPATVVSPSPLGHPDTCRRYCTPTLVRSSTSNQILFGRELGQFADDGSWVRLADTPVESRVAVAAGDSYLMQEYPPSIQRFGPAFTPIDPAPRLPLSSMSVQAWPVVAAGNDRYAVAWRDIPTFPFSSVPTTRVARLDATGTIVDETPIDGPDAVWPEAIVPAADRFVLLQTADPPGPGELVLRAWSLAAQGDADLAGPYELGASYDASRGLFATGEGDTVLVGWRAAGGSHLARLDAHGRVVGEADLALPLLGLCHDRRETIALVGRDTWWVKRIAAEGAPSAVSEWRLRSSTGSSWPALSVAPLLDGCAVLWTQTDGAHAAIVDGDGLLRGPRALTEADGAPVAQIGSAVSSDGYALLVNHSSWRGTLRVLDGSLELGEPFDAVPEQYPSDRIANRRVGASLSPGHHLLVWDSESPVRSVGDYPVRLEARLIGPDRPYGEPCLGAFECASGFCVDGVCCDGECGGGDASDCRACSVAAGAAADGRCGPIEAGTGCRPAASLCDRAEACAGVSLDCPADAPAPDGTDCDDGHACDGVGRCEAGACRTSGPLRCQPPSRCLTGACHDPEGCVFVPIPGCCASDADCDDGDPSTIDACEDATCASTPALDPPGPHDAGAPRAQDAGASDAGASDAGAPRYVPRGGGCACDATLSAPLSGSIAPALALLALVVLRRRSR